MRIHKNLPKTGDVFGKRTIVEVDINKPNDLHYIVKCECGKISSVRFSHLKIGVATKCNSCSLTDHGMVGSPEYSTWEGMKQRCLNEKDPRYKHYGARGIKICEKWLSFNGFYSDMGPKPSSRHSIDRIDVNGNYEPSNCRWATTNEQAINKRKLITRNGIPCSSKYKGVYKPKNSNSFIAEIRRDGKKYNLGSYKEEKDAAFAYDLCVQMFADLSEVGILKNDKR
jgi:hypothetical protein